MRQFRHKRRPKSGIVIRPRSAFEICAEYDERQRVALRER
jgi:hypothetical protein